MKLGLFGILILAFCVGCSVGIKPDLATATTGPKALAAVPRWQLQTMTRGGVVTKVTTLVPTISFKKGRMRGSTGCNSFDGSFRAKANGDFKNLGALVTEMGCLDMKLESDFLAVFGGVTSFDVTAGVLTMTATGGDELVFVPYKSPTPLPLKGTQWQLQYFGESDGTTDGVANVAGTVTLTIAEDGQANGSTGCNEYGMPVAVDGKKLKIGDLVVTALPCATQALTEQQHKLGDLLPKMVRYSTTDTQLTLENADGTRSLIFEKAE